MIRRQCDPTDTTVQNSATLSRRTGKYCQYVTCTKVPFWGDDFESWINTNLPRIFGVPLGPGRNFAGNINSRTQKVQTDIARSIQTGRFMDPNQNFIVASLFFCVPGMIYGLEKYRQIQCMYADCLQNAVGEGGLPVTACEKQRQYSQCKYFTGEIFAVVPWVAFVDHFANLVKDSLSDPFSFAGAILAKQCKPGCKKPGAGGLLYFGCRAADLFDAVGDTIEQVNYLSRDNPSISEDFCEKIKD